ncbi:Putative serine protease inhibitor 1 isoform B [Gryllus bimaculatus]|nr:Putative serine protease inhibitor 1 isoform B [Gryllus bimaculatus]
MNKISKATINECSSNHGMVKVPLQGKLLFLLIFFLVTFTMSESDQKALEVIANSSQRFGLKLYKILREKPGNVFFSPTSLEVVLALAHMGAKGKTAEEILAGLELPNDADLVKSGYNAIMKSLRSTGDMTLEIANKVYSEQTFSVEQEFQLVAEKSFLAAAENVNFIGNPEGSRVVMNSWVEKQTHDKIKDLFGKGDITPDTKMVLINAVYFKGKWKHQFDPSKTSKEPFYITASQTKEVDMMHIKKKFGYLELEDLKAKLLVMPYIGDSMFMVILLPNEVDGLQEMEKKLHSINIADLMKRADHVEVEVTLPRFKIETTIDLVEPLQKLGVKSMFDPEFADFSGISKEKGLYVSKVVQKAFIEVNEEGSEAAAATAQQIRFRRSAVWLEEFKVDRPFLIHLYSVSGVRIFYGSVKEVEAIQTKSNNTALNDISEPPDKHTEL